MTRQAVVVELDGARWIRLLCSICNLAWAPAATLAVVLCLLLAVAMSANFGLVFSDAVWGTQFVDLTMPLQQHLMLLFGVTLVSGLLFAAVIHLPLAHPRLLALASAAGIVVAFWPGYYKALPALWLAVVATAEWIASSDWPGRLLLSLSPFNVERAPGLGVAMCFLGWSAAMFENWHKGGLWRRGLRNAEAVFLVGWWTCATWQLLILPLASTDAVPVLTAAVTLIACGMWEEFDRQADDLAYLLVLAAGAGAALAFLSLQALALDRLPALRLSWAPLFDPRRAAQCPLLAIALLATALPAATASADRPRARRWRFALAAPAAAWLGVALATLGPVDLGRIVFAGIGDLAALVRADKQVILSGAGLSWDAIKHVAGLVSAQWQEGLAFAREYQSTFLTGLLIVLYFGGLPFYAGLVVVLLRLAFSRTLQIAALHPAPRRFGAKIKYALGLAPATYAGRAQTPWTTLLLLLGKFSLSLCALTCAGLYFRAYYYVVGLAGGPDSHAATQGPPSPLEPSLIGAVVVFFAVAFALRHLWQRIDRVPYATVRAQDPRPPVLFLRPFEATTQPRTFLAAGDSAGNIDQLLLHRAAAYGPLLAIGQPNEPSAPYGAARHYIDAGTWQTQVQDLIGQAQLVIVVAGSTAGIAWEIDYLLRNGYRDRTILLLSQLPHNERGKFLALHFGVELALQVTYRAIAICIARGVPVVLCAGSEGHDAHYCALSLCLALKLGHPEGMRRRPVRFDGALRFAGAVAPDRCGNEAPPNG